MNKNLHRVIFNKARGIRMVVQETASSEGKAGNGSTQTGVAGSGASSAGSLRTAKSFLCDFPCFAAAKAAGMLALALGAPAGFAQIIADPSAPNRQRPTVLESANGTPTVNIQTPSAGGVSRNTYQQFDIGQKGAILNNSRSNVQTQIGGWVQGNPWLANGGARVIVNEVNSAAQSRLMGPLEVAGRRADVIIANPSGLVVDGLSFINAAGVTLTTGRPLYGANGAVDGLNVQGGLISIQGNGLDATKADYANILARAISLNAGLWAQDLKVVTGVNQIATDGNVQQSKPSATGAEPAKPRFALDVAQLGGMYAGKIFIVGTESGLGVRNSGLLQAGSGSLTLNSEGWLNNSGSIQSTSSDVVVNTRGAVEQSGAIYGGGNVQLSSQASQAHSGTVAASGDVSIQAAGAGAQIQARDATVWAAGLQTDGRLLGDKNLSVHADAQLQTSGQALATRNVQMRAASLDLSSSRQQAKTLQLHATTGDLQAKGSQLLATEQMTLQTGQTLTTDGARVQASSLGIHANALSNVGGQIIQSGGSDQTIALQEDLDNRAGLIQTAAGNLNIAARNIDNTAGQLLHAGGGSFNLSSQGQLLNDSRSSNQPAVADGARIVSNGSLYVQAQALSNSGSVHAAQALETHASTLNNSGVMYSAGSQALTVDGGMSSSATIGAARNLTVKAGSFNGAATHVLAAGMGADGKLAGAGVLTATASAHLQSAGQILAAGNVSLDAASLDLRQSSAASTAGNMSLTAQSGDIQTGGARISSAGLLAIRVDGSSSQRLDNTLGQISATQLSIKAGELDNTDGLISAVEQLDITSAQLINGATPAASTAKGIQSQTGDVHLNVQQLDNSGNIQAAKNLAVTTSSLGNSGTLYAGRAQTLNASGAITSSGTIAAAQDLNVTAASFAGAGSNVLAAGMAADGKLVNPGTLNVTTSAGLQTAGQALAANNVNLGGASLDLESATAGSANADVNLSAAQGSIVTAGSHISTPGKLSITANTVAGQALDNTAGRLAGQQLQIQVGQLNNHQGSIEQSGGADLDINLRGGALNNNAGRIVVNAANIKLQSGALDNTDGLISHAGSGHGALQASSLDNTRGQILGNGTLSLASSGNVSNSDGLISSNGDLQLTSADLGNTRTGTSGSATGIQSQGGNLTVNAQAITNSSNLYAAKDLKTTATSLDNSATLYAAGEQTLDVAGAVGNQGTIAAAKNLSLTADSFAGGAGNVLSAGMAANGQLSGSGALTAVTSGSLQTNGQALATGLLNLKAASLDLQGSTTGSTGADVTLSATTGDIQAAQARISTPGLLSISTTAGQKLDSSKAQLSGGQLSIDVGEIDNTEGVIQQTDTASGAANPVAGIRSAGAINNSAGRIVANAQDFAVVSGGVLDNTDGMIGHAGSGQLRVDTGGLHNTRGKIIGNGATALTSSANVDNTGGMVAGQQSVTATATAWDNSQGTLVAVQGDLNLHTTTNAVKNAAGLIQAENDIRLTLDGAGNQLHNGQGKIVSGRDAILSTGQMDNDAGLVAAGRNLGIDTHQQSLSNQASRSSAGALGLVAGAQLDIHSGTLNNQGGLISAQTDLNITSSGAIDNTEKNAQAAQIYSGAQLNLQSTGIDNAGSQILAVQGADISVGSGTLTNQAGLVRVGQALTIQAGAIDNQNTLALNGDGSAQALGLEASTISVTAAKLDNSQGAVRAGQDLTILSDGRLINDRGELSAGNQLKVTADQAATPTLNISNNAGQIVADHKVDLRTGSLNGAGEIASRGDVSLHLQGDHTLAGTLQAGGNLQLQTTGTLTNPVTVQAGKSLTVNASNLDNQATGELLSGQTTQLTIANTLTNRGLIDGADTRIQAGNVNNVGTGRIYGDRVAIAASALTNQEETVAGITQAATIAARERMDLGVQNITNRENALIYSAGNLFTGGALDSNWHATGAGQTLNNNSATLESAASMVLGHDQVRNTNEHLQWTLVDGQPQKIVEFQAPNGQRYKGSDVLLISNGNVGGSGSKDISFVVSGNDWRCSMGGETCSFTTGETTAFDQYYKGLLLPSERYPFEKYAPYYNPSYVDDNGQRVQGYMHYSGDRTIGFWTGGELVKGAHYAADHRIWSDFGVQPYTGPAPVLSSTNPCAALARCTVGYHTIESWDSGGRYAQVTQAHVDEYNAYKPRLDARNAADAALDAKLDAFYQDIRNRWIGAFVFYDYSRTEQSVQVTQSSPGKILAGGNLQWNGSNSSSKLLNQDSTILAGGTISAMGGSLDNRATTVDVKSVDQGYVYSTWKGGSSTPNRKYSGSVYAPAGAIKTQTLASYTYTEHAANPSTGAAPGASAISAVQAQASAAGAVDAIHHSVAPGVVQGTQAGPAAGAATATQTQGQITSNAVAGVAAQESSAQAQASAKVGAAATPESTAADASNARSASSQFNIRTTPPNTRIPGASLYRQRPEAGALYLVETDPRFTQYKNWLSSDYMLQALQMDPGTVQKRLGDGFYEQQLVQQQIGQLTGRRFLGNYTSNDEQYKDLLQNGATFAQAQGLRPGIELSATQVAQLTSDIVWLVTKEVTLPDGSRQSVLVPQVYVRVKPGDLDGTGTLLAGSDVNLNLSGNVVNSGSIVGRNTLSITAENIQNLGGQMSGNDVKLAARQDFDNLAGMIKGVDSATVSAGRDLNLTTTTQSSENQAGGNRFTQTGIDRVAGIYVSGPAGVLVASAGNNLNLTAAQIQNAGTGATVLTAGNKLNLNTVAVGSSQDINWDSKNYLRQSSTLDVGTQITGAGRVTLSAGQDINAKAATIDAGKALSLSAGNDIQISAGQASQSLDEAHQHTNKGFLSSKTVTTREQLHSTTTVGSNLGGDTVAINAGRDIAVTASHVVSDTGTSLLAGRDVTIAAAQETSSEQHYRKETKSGIFGGGGGIGFTIGSRMQSADQTGTRTTAAASTVGSVGGDVNIVAGNAYKQVGSDVMAPGGDVNVVAKEVQIVEARETGSSATEQRFKQSGLSVSIGSPVISAIQTADNMADAARNTSSGRMQALAAAATALNVKNSAGELQGAAQALAGGDPTKAASISISLGSSKSQSNTAQTSDSARGSTVKAGGNVNILAQGAGADSSILVRGSDIAAGQDATLAAEGDIRLQAAQNTASLGGRSSSSSGSIGVSVGQQTGITVSASKGRGNQAGDDLTHTNTHIAAGNSVTLQSGGDTDLKGAVVSGKQVVAEVGGDLNIESLQDSSSYASRNQSAGGSLTISPAGVPIGGGLNAGRSKVNSNYQSVTEQSGIQAGDGGFQVSVKGDTDLKGAVIASNQTAVEQGKNRFNTEGALTTSDLHNSAHYDGQAVGVNASVGNDAGKFGVKGVGAGVGQDSGSAQGTTTAGISGIAGDQSVRTGDATGIERIFDQNKVQREIDAQVAITAEFGKQASKAVGDYAGRKYNELKDSDPVEAAKWSEGGAYRVAMHAVVGGLSGGVQGLMGATAASTAAPYIDQLQEGFQSALQNAGLGEGAAKVLASLAGGATATTIGAVASGGSAAGAATAFNSDMNNRQLHPSERLLARTLAVRSNGKYTVTQIEDALRVAGNTETGESIVAGMVVDPSERDAIYDSGAVWTIGSAGQMVQVVPKQPAADLLQFIQSSTAGQYDWYMPSSNGNALASTPRDRLTGAPLDEQGRYSQIFILDGKKYQPKYFPCAKPECLGSNLDSSDPGTQAYIKAMDAQIFKDISTGANYATLMTPAGASGQTLAAVGLVASAGSAFTDSNALDELLKYGSQKGGEKLFVDILGHTPANAARAIAIIDLSGGWSAFVERFKVDILGMRKKSEN
ncbi:hemagglutinin repeat-containing protein [Comamonas sp. NyZ500]|uniref:hemagglutinin repeat-containing protein n=1 Tax=Comamonas sp. NyZ500 TaxID=2795732 RepID=UPI00192BAC11|nr:hemagglutinin repeat-containing protein [Comamonas sp. NyZ500]MBL5980374.1 hemagglutinin repeat-containing protein [Comamonas sp. NyZ500]